MLTSEKVATAAHLHVLLRRKTGRVTDTEWMAENNEYALAMVRFARTKARDEGHTDLAEWADKLERAVLESDKPRKPLMQTVTVAQLFKPQATVARPFMASQDTSPSEPASQFGELSEFAHSGFVDSKLSQRRRESPAPRYVGGIR